MQPAISGEWARSQRSMAQMQTLRVHTDSICWKPSSFVLRENLTFLFKSPRTSNAETMEAAHCESSLSGALHNREGLKTKTTSTAPTVLKLVGLR